MLKLQNIDNIPFEKHRVGDLVIIGINTSAACNLRCRYCPEDSGSIAEGETTLEERKSILDQARELGARVMLVAGTGEPLIDPNFFPTIEHAYSLGLGTLAYTNGLEGNSPQEIRSLSLEKARFLWDYNVTPIVKLESLVVANHDSLTFVKGSHDGVMESLKRLQSVGYGRVEGGTTRIGIASLYTTINKTDLGPLKIWCENRGMKFSADLPRIFGSLCSNRDLVPDFFNATLTLEESIVRSQGCPVRMYGIVIDHLGNARFCAEAATGDIGNIRDQSLKKLLEIKNRRYPAIGEFPIAGCCFLKLGGYFPPAQESSPLLSGK